MYPLDRLYEEMAYIAYHFHWPYEEIMHMDHHERCMWVERIGEINSKLYGLAVEAE